MTKNVNPTKENVTSNVNTSTESWEERFREKFGSAYIKSLGVIYQSSGAMINVHEVGCAYDIENFIKAEITKAVEEREKELYGEVLEIPVIDRDEYGFNTQINRDDVLNLLTNDDSLPVEE